MAEHPSPARRTNRILAAAAATVLVGTAVVAIAVGSPSRPGSDSAPPDGSPTVAAGSRPAGTSLSWFDHSMGVEQFDYDMDRLSCRSVAESITPDVCAVATSPHGDFMLVGSEGFWDPAEVDSEGFAHISLNFSIFTMRKDHGSPRAVSVMDGNVDQKYSRIATTLDVLSATVNGSEILVLRKHLSDPKADAYSAWDEVQILAASSTGAPTVVATYRGAHLEVAATGTSILLSSLRYRASGPAGSEWFTRITLTPSETDPADWTETVTSGPEAVTGDSGLTLVDTFRFPHRDSLPAPVQT